MGASKWADKFGWFFEKGFIWCICTLYLVTFLGNYLLLLFQTQYGSKTLENLLEENYLILLHPNIGTITTIASIFVGIYITVLTVLGSLKANSIMALLSNNDLKRIVKYISTGLLSSFLVVFYSFIAITLKNEFFRSFIFFFLLIYMLLTAIRLGVNLYLIYSHDLKKLSENLENEQREAEKNRLIMNRLEQYLTEKDAERLRNGN